MHRQTTNNLIVIMHPSRGVLYGEHPFFYFMDYLILTLATWRISSLLISEHGPWHIFERLRALVGVQYHPETFERIASSMLSEMFTCIWCMSVWVGILLTVAYYLLPQVTIWLMLPLALSTAALAINRVIDDAN